MANYRWDSLRSFVAAVFKSAGSDPEEALLVADNLVRANMRGVDSHGVMRVPSYLRRLKTGLIATPASMRVVRETPVTAVLDGANGWGAVVGKAAMDLAMAKAGAVGMGAVGVVNSNHFGYAAYYGEMALAQGLIGIALTNANPVVPAFGGRVAVEGTNPICICVPAGKEPPFVFDAATTVVARGKVDLAIKKGISIPDNWGLTADGLPTTDPSAVVLMQSLGGYKGFDLAVAVDILCGVLNGGPFAADVGRLREGDTPQYVGHFLLAIKIEAFREPAQFRADMDSLLCQLRQPRADGQGHTLVAGDPERAAFAERQQHGVPLPDEIERDLRQLAAEAGLCFPDPVG
ncbi:MAG: Ldh family oxidoreductase [Bacillota bacterium]|nr:Ldh family oxidoreductase [Bacillota bacterium]